MYFIIAAAVVLIISIVGIVKFSGYYKYDSQNIFCVVTAIVSGIVLLISLIIGLAYTNQVIDGKGKLYAFQANIAAYEQTNKLIKDAIVEVKDGEVVIDLPNAKQSTNNSQAIIDYRNAILEYNQMYFHLKTNVESKLNGQFIWCRLPSDLKPYVLKENSK